MAIQWGPWAGSAPKRFRMGVEFHSISRPSPGSSTVYVTADIYVGAHYSFYDDGNSFAISGDLGSVSTSKHVRVATNGVQKLHTISGSVALQSSASTAYVSASLSGIDYIGRGHRAGVTATVSIPARVPNPPGAASNVRVYFNGDSYCQVEWSPGSNVGHYQAWLEEIDTGKTWSIGTTTNRVIGTNSTRGNQGYWAYVQVHNASGSSVLAQSPWIVYTSPHYPQPGIVRRVGSDVEVTWKHASKHADWMDVFGSTDDGKSWQRLATVARAYTSWVHKNPDPQHVWAYAIQAVISEGKSGINKRLVSERVRVGHLRPVAPPSAPNIVSPIGTSFDVNDGPVTLTWQHRATDASAQTAAEVRHRKVGAVEWITSSIDGAQSTHTVTLDVGRWEWQVRTRGTHEDYGPWSALAAFTVGTRPGLAITSPAADSTVDRSRVTITWQSVPAQGVTIARHEVELRDDSGTVLASTSGAGDPGTWQADVRLADDRHFIAVVRVVDATGLTGSVTSRFYCDFALPARPVVLAVWDDDTASMTLTVQAGEESGAPETASILVERSLTGGASWHVVTEPLAPGTTMSDPMPPLRGVIQYRAIAISDLPSERGGEPVTVQVPMQSSVWMSTAAGDAIRLPHDLTIQGQHETRTELHRTAGRRLPVSVAPLDEEPSQIIQVSGTTLISDDAPTEADWRRTVLSGPIFYRDPTGRAFWGIVKEFTWNPTWYGHCKVTFNIQEVDRA